MSGRSLALNNISSTIRRLNQVFLVLFIALSGGLVYWQVVVAQQVAANPSLNLGRQCSSDAAPMRGSIFDRNGVLLASSVKSDVPGLCGYKRVYTQAAQGLEGLLGYYISPTFGMTGIEKQFNDYLTGAVGLTGLSNTVNGVLHVPPRGDDIYLTIDSRIEKILEQNFDTQVPPDGVQVFRADSGSVTVSDPTTGEILGIISRPGYDNNCIVYCTLDQLRTDFIARGYDQTIGCQASCTLSQFQAALNTTEKTYPQCWDNNDCNLVYFEHLNSDPKLPLLFRPLQSCTTSGSTFKTMTLVAALDSGTMTLDSPFYQNDPAHPASQFPQAEGPVRVGSGDDSEKFTPDESNIMGYTTRFPVSLAYGFVHSDNVIFAQTGVKVGADTWMKYNRAFYVDQKVPFDLPVRVSTVTPQPQQDLCSYTPPPETPLSVRQLAENSFGQGVVSVTALQMVLLNNAVADDGKLMRPTVIEKIVDPTNQTVLQPFTPQMLSQPISATTAQQVRDTMYGVNMCGSGSLIKVQLSYPYTPWAVIGKTGTGQVTNTGIPPAQSWYITQAPYAYQSNQTPRLTIVAMKEHGGEGAYANGPMLRDIYNQIFTNVIKIQQPAPPPNNFCRMTGFLQF